MIDMDTTAKTEESASPRERPQRRWLEAISFQNASAVYIAVILVIVFALWVPDTFLTATTWKSLLDTQVITALVAIGLCVPLATGVFDLSIGMTLGVGSVVSAFMLVKAGLPTPVAILIALAVGALIGLANGLIVTLLNVDSFITTLGMTALLTAFVQWITSGQQILGLPSDFQALAAGQLFGVTYPVYILLAVAFLLWYVLERTPLGRQFYATGGNAEAARLAGVKTKRRIVMSFMIGSTVAAGAGVLLAGRLGTGDPTIGGDYLLPAFTAVFLGATQFKRGRFNIWGTLVAVYVVALGVKGILLAGAPTWMPYLFNGAVLIIAVALSKVQTSRRLRGRKRAGTEAQA
ncbi:ABC transporter permease [Microbacterium sp. F2]